MPRGTPTCIRVARKEYKCSEWSYHTIRVGDRYLYAECPPEHEMNRTGTPHSGKRRWTYIRACLRCANEYGMHTSDTRKQLEQANAPAPR